jgi:glycosyltransferase involved in cell wall biosynthesis
MAKRGHHVQIICHKSRTDALDLPQSQDLVIHRIDPEVNLLHGSFPSIADQVSFVFRMIREGRKIIRKNRIDIIHANTLNPTIAGALLGHAYKIPVVNTVHHIHSVQSNGNNLYKSLQMQNANPVIAALGNFTRTIYEKIIAKLPAERIHSVSTTTCNDLRRFGYEGKIEVIPNGVELEKFDDASHSISYQPYLLFIGRHVDYKNLGVVIEGFAAACKVLPNARLVVAGDGPMHEIWKKKAVDFGISERIEFRGYVSEDEKIDLLRRCSALVFPSLVEGFGMVVLEAFAMKKPVLVSNIASLTELVQDRINGFVISPSSSEDWAMRMTTILADPTLSRAMGIRGRKRVEDYYRIDRVAGMVELLYQDVYSKTRINLEQERIPSQFQQ